MINEHGFRLPSGKTAIFFIGYLNESDYQTQGTTKEELVDNLEDLLVDLESGEVPFVHRVEELLVA